MRDMVSEKREASGGWDEPLISGAICSALCAIHKRKQDFLCSRIAVLTPSVDYPFFLTTQYMNFMNAYFTAQKMDVMIDVAVRKGSGSTDDSSSSILRQGCDITGGSYLSVPKPEALFQYLIVSPFSHFPLTHCNAHSDQWVLLPDQQTRKNMVLPHKTPVGSKAACFCHRTILDVGYVCSVCLSGMPLLSCPLPLTPFFSFLQSFAHSVLFAPRAGQFTHLSLPL